MLLGCWQTLSSCISDCEERASYREANEEVEAEGRRCAQRTEPYQPSKAEEECSQDSHDARIGIDGEPPGRAEVVERQRRHQDPCSQWHHHPQREAGDQALQGELDDDDEGEHYDRNSESHW